MLVLYFYYGNSEIYRKKCRNFLSLYVTLPEERDLTMKFNFSRKTRYSREESLEGPKPLKSQNRKISS